MNYSDLIAAVDSAEIDVIERELHQLKQENKALYFCYIDKLKVYFILSDSIEKLNKLALVFSTFKIHSAVPLILSKLLSGKYDTEGGTLLYSLLGLKRVHFKEELQEMENRNNSFEMNSMLEKLNRN